MIATKNTLASWWRRAVALIACAVVGHGCGLVVQPRGVKSYSEIWKDFAYVKVGAIKYYFNEIPMKRCGMHKEMSQ